jgi:hypothetical protein
MLKRPLTGISELDSSCESFRKSQDHLTWMGWSQNGPHSMVPTLWFQSKVSDSEMEWGTLLSDPDQSMMNCCSLVGGGWIFTMFFSTLGRFKKIWECSWSGTVLVPYQLGSHWKTSGASEVHCESWCSTICLRLCTVHPWIRAHIGSNTNAQKASYSFIYT